MLKWILVAVIVVAFPAEVGHLLAEAVVLAKESLTTMIAAYNNKGI
jgi:hypothetical protein